MPPVSGGSWVTRTPDTLPEVSLRDLLTGASLFFEAGGDCA